jgi:hypothetical protein
MRLCATGIEGHANAHSQTTNQFIRLTREPVRPGISPIFLPNQRQSEGLARRLHTRFHYRPNEKRRITLLLKSANIA